MKLVSVRSKLKLSYIETPTLVWNIRHQVNFNALFHIRDRVVDEFFKKIRERR